MTASRLRSIPEKPSARRVLFGGVWPSLAAAGLLLVAGSLAIVFAAPILFPSLGPTIFLQVEAPRLRSSRLYNALVGQLLGYGSGLLGLAVFDAWHAPSVLSGHPLDPARLGASALGLAVAIFLGFFARAAHPPASATVLLVTLSGFATTPLTLFAFLVGLVVIAVGGELVRQARLRTEEPPAVESKEAARPESLGPAPDD